MGTSKVVSYFLKHYPFIIENKTFKPRFDESDPLIQEIYLKEIE